MFGAWGEALAPGGTSLLQLRALDWDMQGTNAGHAKKHARRSSVLTLLSTGPFRDYSQITVYHPNEGNGHGFVNVGYTAFIGGLTGMSATQLGISEIGAAFADASFGEMSRMGVPFVFLLRDILQFDYTIDDAINRMINSRRTCDLMLGVGDGKLNEFRGFQYSYSVLNIFNDLNLKPDNSSWHPRIKDVVYWGMV
jgi:exportin-7